MDSSSFKTLAENLTGTGIKGDLDAAVLDPILENEAREIDCSQFNELLLLAHKDRVEAPFFKHFFQRGGVCTIGSLRYSVQDFQKLAMLMYGNFAFAYRTLSRIKKLDRFMKTIECVNQDPDAVKQRFLDRAAKLVDIDLIDQIDTPYVGYLSSVQLSADQKRCALLLDAYATGNAEQWAEYTQDVEALASPEERPFALQVITAYRSQSGGSTVSDFAAFLNGAEQKLADLQSHADDVRNTADKNQDIYLSWDHMDVYFATSMRKDWEYRDLFRFIDELTESAELKELNLRYFDPTQSFTKNRIHKGLVESLMLKRAACTVYSIQDNDTLGKDSELASTLAQGKPVIAYIPLIDIGARASELFAGDLGMINGRLNVVLSSEEARERFSKQAALSEPARWLQGFVLDEVWRSLPDEEHAKNFRAQYDEGVRLLCRFVAEEEHKLYNKRAKMLSKDHPLAIQVNLETGVANGLLVVRTIGDCAKLLHRILISDMRFNVVEDADMWSLVEEISQGQYRVVTKDPKLSNCFWNFYLRGNNEKE